ncbi:MAG TPA: hypothetical protein VFI68_01035 [Anaerolineales bacterium]|nr:hypothetical protein [Anaerolineales bacterium]
MYLQTARLNIRNFYGKDLDPFFTYHNDPHAAKYQGWGIPFSREKAGKFISSMKAKTVPKPGEWLQFAVALKIQTK